MVEQFKNRATDYGIFSVNTSSIKEEYEDNDYVDVKALVCKTAVNRSDSGTELKCNEIFIRDYFKAELSSSEEHNIMKNMVKVENEINVTDDIKTEISNKQLFCHHCHDNYQDYCTKCDMLAHILNKNTSCSTFKEAREEIPRDILEYREGFGSNGIFALKIIPKGVKFGPFAGLSNSGGFWKIKGGKFLTNEDKTNQLNWMQYIKAARTVSEQNLYVFQYEDNIYYRSSREIGQGEELLVYFGGEYEESLHKNVEMDFVPNTERDAKNVFACTFCCLGFSEERYLMEHKDVCLNEASGMFSIQELTQCLLCKVHMEKKEYLEYHMTYCSKINFRRCELPSIQDDKKPVAAALSSDSRPVGFQDRSSQFKRTASDYKTNRASMSAERAKGGIVRQPRYDCAECEYKAIYKCVLENHIKSTHRREINYECAQCPFKTYYKSSFELHTNAMHLKETKHRCGVCEYETRYKSALTSHLKKKHRRETCYKCTECQFETNYRTSLNTHMKARHLRESNYRCSNCEYVSLYRSNLEKHIKRVHQKRSDFECDDCEYKTDSKTSFEFHLKARHSKKAQYKCADCKYKTNEKRYIMAHIKTKHLRECNYKCERCVYQTNYKANLMDHVNRKHPQEGGPQSSSPNSEQTTFKCER